MDGLFLDDGSFEAVAEDEDEEEEEEEKVAAKPARRRGSTSYLDGYQEQGARRPKGRAGEG